MRTTLPILLLIIGSALAACPQADSHECATTLCATYNFLNGTCTLNSTSTCTTGTQVQSGTVCVTCSSLASSTCTSTCVDFYFNTGTSTCTNCATTYQADCVACTNSVCTACAYSSNKVLAANGLTCVLTTCTTANCLTCYTTTAGVERCQTCNTGFSVDSSYACVPSSCSISNCKTCATTSTCGTCNTGYALGSSNTACDPVCSDTNCVTCLQPNFCGTCVTGYNPISGVCTIDCTQNVVANCLTCTVLTVCSQCISTHVAVLGGTVCTPICNDVNCLICSSTAAAACTTCNTGYSLGSGICTKITCSIDYCATCSTTLSNTCTACDPFFTLSANTCTPTCLGTVSNCLICSSNTACQTCDIGFTQSGGVCNALCSILNCAICSSSTTCGTCSANYQLSTNQGACNLICTVSNCATCTTAPVCTACNTGFNVVTAGGVTYCVAQCGTGEVNTGTTLSPTCQACGVVITNCNTCQGSPNPYCTACITGLFIDGAGNCVTCSSALANCFKCSSLTTCTECNSGFNLVSGACVTSGCASTVTNCFQCAVSTTSCSTCATGYVNTAGVCGLTCAKVFILDGNTGNCVCPAGSYQINGGCTSCNAKCISCTSSKCNACKQKYYVSSQSCLRCGVHCISCTSSTNCITCKPNFYSSSGTCLSLNSPVHLAATQSSSGAIITCPTGCDVCSVTTTGTSVACTTAMNGYSIIGGVLTACDTSCKSCSGTTSSSCTACYDTQVLSAGVCTSCTDPNALVCLSTNTGIVSICKPGFTASFYTDAAGTLQNGGTCQACGLHCKICDLNGPGKCDADGCFEGYVVFSGNTDCSACFAGCPVCSTTDISNCLSCPDGQFGSGGVCSLCPSTCTTCTSTTACTTCPLGSELISGACYTKPVACVALSQTTPTICSTCLSGYNYNNATNTCDLDTTCSASTSCTACISGQYLSGGVCSTCSNLPANCLTCSATTTTNCFQCNSGYYLSAGQCAACVTGCSQCDSAIFCTSVSSGFYLVLDSSAANTGIVGTCISPCATCTIDSKECTSCISTYSLNGTYCISDSLVSMTLTLVSSGAIPVFSSTATAAATLADSMAAMNRVHLTICQHLPTANFDTSTQEKCFNVVIFNNIAAGSLILGTTISTGTNFGSPSQASSTVNSAFSGAVLDGVTVAVVTTSASGFSSSSTSTSSSGTNLGLILGLSIPLLLLLILIIIILVVNRNKQEQDPAASNDVGVGETGSHVSREGADYDKI